MIEFAYRKRIGGPQEYTGCLIDDRDSITRECISKNTE